MATNNRQSGLRAAFGAVFFLASVLAGALVPAPARAQVIIPPGFVPLNQVAVPEPPNIAIFVKNEDAAIRLGKAFFWDMQAGSDGLTACATCHFSAGADSRRKNTLNPGAKAGDTVFGNNTSGVQDFTGDGFGPNFDLTDNFFPLNRWSAPQDSPASVLIQDTNDVVGSQGVRRSNFVSIVPGSPVDNTTPVTDPVFGNFRRVTGRNAPTVINAVFNFNNFWDGRARFLFNGENPFGPFDPNAGVWFNRPAGLVKEPVSIPFASLASQATGPPLDDTEMSATGRTFPMLGRKMLSLVPLGRQIVHPGDSALGLLSRATILPNGALTGSTGLNTTYAQMIQAAFQNVLWNAPGSVNVGGATHTQMEANFALFWGLAIQLYEATLVSDETPFDNWVGGDANALTPQEQQGFQLFNSVAGCFECHAGPEFTAASVAVADFISNADNGLFDEMTRVNGTPNVYDAGYNNTAVTMTTDDLGQGATAPFVNPITGLEYPLSLSRLAKLRTQIPTLLPFATPTFPVTTPPLIPAIADGAFKAPGLRNVELTAPYFHNGSVLDLADVMDFYVRGGNFRFENIDDIDPVIFDGVPFIQNNESLHQAVIAFMRTLTDPRVVAESAPFDHPELLVPEGDPEILTRIPARNAAGVPAPTPTLMLSPVASPTSIAAQTIAGNVEDGLTPTVVVDPPAIGGPLTVNGTVWSFPITGLVEGPNRFTVSVTSQGVLTEIVESIVLDTIAPALTLNPVVKGSRSPFQAISGTIEPGLTPVITVTGTATVGPPVVTGGTNWSCLIANLPNGGTGITVSAVDGAGNATTISEQVSVGPRSISGLVRDRRGRPIPGVTMTLKGRVNLTVVTDERGRFTLAGLIRGKYGLSVSKPGFVFRPSRLRLRIDRKNLARLKFLGRGVAVAER